MAGAVTLATLVTRVRQRSDQVGTTFVTDSELQDYISSSVGDLYDLILSVNSSLYEVVTDTNSTVAGTQVYTPLRTGATEAVIYKILGVEILWDGEWRRIEPYAAPNHLSLEDQTGWVHFTEVFYHPVMAASVEGPVDTVAGYNLDISFIPTPQSVESFRVRYVPAPGNWASLGGGYNFQGFSGWEDWVINDVAAKVAEKEESFELADRLLSRRDRAEVRIRWAAATMDTTSQSRVRDLDEERRMVHIRRSAS